jgi:hypothetical protein
MEAKDTILKGEELDRIQLAVVHNQYPNWNNRNDVLTPCLMEQAEISFKAGYEEGLSLKGVPAAIALARKNGIREVVEWINSREEIGYLNQCGFNHIWRAKLKEWEIDAKS